MCGETSFVLTLRKLKTPIRVGLAGRISTSVVRACHGVGDDDWPAQEPVRSEPPSCDRDERVPPAKDNLMA
jgi:hypothetical protein